jgi:hypothetical protein
MGQPETSREELTAVGWTVRRGVFSADEVRSMRSAVDEAMDEARRRGTVDLEEGPEGRVEISVGDLLSYDVLGPVLLDARVRDLARDVLGAEPVYFGDSSFRIGASGGRAWHRDNVDRNYTDFAGPDWQGEYPVIRMGIYLQDMARHSGGLCVGEGSNRDARRRGRGRFAPAAPGDLVAWSLRTMHSAEAVRIRGLPGLVLHPRLQSKVPGWARVSAGDQRMVLFMSFARESPLLDRYLEYLGGRTYFQASVSAASYSASMRRRIEESGLVVVGPAAEVAGRP